MNFFCLSSKFGVWVVSANLCLSSPLGATGYTMYVVYTPETLYLLFTSKVMFTHTVLSLWEPFIVEVVSDAGEKTE